MAHIENITNKKNIINISDFKNVLSSKYKI
jgi:hypothetical protein